MNLSHDSDEALGCTLEGWEERNRSMIERLDELHLLDDDRWRSAFTDVPRHLFVPRFIRDSVIVDCADPATAQQWRDEVYTDTSLIVQTAPAPHYGSELPTSSSTLPSLMVRMLNLLDAEDDSRILEIGTATGYNTAILCHALGGGNVTTVELHHGLSAAARRRFISLGINPTVVTGDGAAGHPPNAPYDRILATCAANQVPAAWIQQLRIGGRIVTDIRAEMSSHLVVLHKTGPDRVEGRILDFPGYFMWLRPDPHSPLLHPGQSALLVHRDAEDNDTSVSEHDPYLLRQSGLRVAVSALEPNLRAPLSLTGAIDSSDEDFFFYADDGSWSDAIRTADGRLVVTQGGPRRVWDSVENAIARWESMGRPDPDRYGLTVTTDGTHTYWVDEPSRLLFPDSGDSANT